MIMLSRVANSLYWMSRYMERAENIARILDVNLQLQLDLPRLQTQDAEDIWIPLLKCTGDEDEFYRLYKEATTETVIEFLALNPENPNSMVTCITNARENARHVREQISLEMWEEINRFYLWMKSQSMQNILQVGPSEFFMPIKNASHLFQGVTDSTMTNGEDWDFIQVGKWLERADKTTRILDANDEIFFKGAEGHSTTGTLLWSAILRSCSAHDAYRKFYVAQIEPRKVEEFLILNEYFPRSIRYCVQAVNGSLRRISGCKEEHFTNLAEKLAGRLVAELNYSSIDDITGITLHKYLDELQTKLNAIGDAIFETYWFSPPAVAVSVGSPSSNVPPVVTPLTNPRSTTPSLGSDHGSAKEVLSEVRRQVQTQTELTANH